MKWFNQNEVKHGGIKKRGMALVQWAPQFLDEYDVAAISSHNPLMSPLVSWSPPSTSMFKIKVNGMVFSAHNSMGVGVIIRDDKRRVETTLSKKI